MKIKNKNYSTLWVENSKIKIIDQTKLPFKLIIKELKTLDDFCRAITQMEVRGAPLIGVTAAFGLALGIRKDASSKNIDKSINALLETRRLAVERGACPDDDSCEVRNAHLLAIAPNASSSIICGNTSPSIEPFRANAYTQKTKSGSYLQKNKYLDVILRNKCKSEQEYEEAWKSIVANKGSVQHLSMLSEQEKEVYKTAVEINQSWVVEHASNRQPYICQSQSVNLFFPPDVNKGDLHNVHMLAWAKNLKTLYYLRSEAISRADNVTSQAKREIIFEQQDCLSCEG